jgi:hypothetical protein
MRILINMNKNLLILKNKKKIYIKKIMKQI